MKIQPCTLCKKQFISFDKETVCGACISAVDTHTFNSKIFCFYCGAVVDNYSIYNSLIICSSCSNARCAICSRKIRDGQGKEIDGKRICLVCYGTRTIMCEECKNRFIPQGRNTIQCKKCNDKIALLEIKGYWGVDEEKPSYSNIEKYYTTTDQKIYKRFPYLGVELEVNADKNFKAITGVINKHLVKDQDGAKFFLQYESTHGVDFELTSYPASLLYHKRRMGWKKILDFMHSMGAKAYETQGCGLHIHINKDFATEYDWRRMAYFIHNQKLRGEIIARRSASCHNHDYVTGQYLPYYEKIYNKFTAMNTVAHSYTCEVRIFKGTLDFQMLIVSLEYVDSVARFSCTVTDGDIIANSDEVWNKYLDFIYQNRHRLYDELIAYIESRDIKYGMMSFYRNNTVVTDRMVEILGKKKTGCGLITKQPRNAQCV